MKKNRSYSYVGPEEIIAKMDTQFEGYKIYTSKDIQKWIVSTKQVNTNQRIIATFIINEQEELVISDRHSEHVFCAGGKKVLSAGEITFCFDDKEIYVSEISNQSTGYCPKPNSWQVVEIVLDTLNIEYPPYFTSAFKFRHCEHCQSNSLIKEDIFVCAVCDTTLDLEWNFDKITKSKQKNHST